MKKCDGRNDRVYFKLIVSLMFFFAVGAVLLFAPRIVYAGADVTAPKVKNLSLSSTSVGISKAIDFTLDIEENESGLQKAEITYIRWNGNNGVYCEFGHWFDDEKYTGKVTFSDTARTDMGSGESRLFRIVVTDTAGNSREYMANSDNQVFQDEQGCYLQEKDGTEICRVEGDGKLTIAGGSAITVRATEIAFKQAQSEKGGTIKVELKVKNPQDIYNVNISLINQNGSGYLSDDIDQSFVVSGDIVIITCN